jgi:probable HAF family extracellular repeat protein
MHDLDTLGGTGSRGYSINASGTVAGEADTSGVFPLHAFTYDTSMHDLGTLGGSQSGAHAINDSGVVAGYSNIDGGTSMHAFRYDTSMHDLGTLNGVSSNAFGINAAGTVTGWAALDNGTIHAFTYDTSMHDLGTLGGTFASGNAINDSGQVAGASNTSGGDSHAFVYDSVHGMVDLNTLINPSSGWILEHGFGINNLGQITGDGMIGEEIHAFLLTPVPEPSSLVLGSLAFAIGSGAVLWRRHRGATSAHGIGPH